MNDDYAMRDAVSYESYREAVRAQAERDRGRWNGSYDGDVERPRKITRAQWERAVFEGRTAFAELMRQMRDGEVELITL